MLIFEVRRLKKLLNEAWDKQDTMLEANRELQKKINELKSDVEFEKSEVKRRDEKIKSLQKQVLEASKMVREQTGADLLVNALRELGVVPKPDYPLDSFKEQQRLNDQMARAQAMRPQSMSEIRAGNAFNQQFGGLANTLGMQR